MAKIKTKAREEAKSRSKAPERPRSDVVHERILELEKGLETGYLELAELLSEACYSEYWRVWGYSNSEEFFEAELVDYRKARYMVNIWDKVKSLELPREEVEVLGWSKMKDIASIINAENAKEWLEKAQGMSCREVTETVKVVRRKQGTGKSNGDDGVPAVSVMKLVMSSEEAGIIQDAISEAKKLCETKSDVTALGMICQDWSESHGTIPQRSTIEDHVKFLSKTYGVDVSFKVKAQPKAKKEKKKDPAEETMERAEKKARSKKQQEEDPDLGLEELEEGEPEELGEDDDLNAILGLDED